MSQLIPRRVVLASMVAVSGGVLAQPAAGENGTVRALKARSSGIGFEMPCALTADTAEFEKDLANLLDTGATWVRLGWAYWELSDYSRGVWIWNEENWGRARRRIEMVRDAGLKVCLVSAAIRDVPEMSLREYIDMNRTYWKRTMQCAAEAGGVDVYQVYNEHNTRDFRSNDPLPEPLPRSYLEDWRRAIAAARQEAHAVMPSVLVTTCIGTNVNTKSWWEIYDVVSPACDIIGINAYPGTYVPAIDNLTDQIRQTRARYKKPVIITETGLPVYAGGSPVSIVNACLPRMVTRAAEGGPLAVIVYQLRNSGTDETEPEQMFGIFTKDHIARSTRAPLVRAIRAR